MKTLPEVESGEDISGSTAVCTLISPTHFFFANCGDSRGVLSRDGRTIFSTQDHKPVNPTEKERIQRAGGSVMIQRVNGSLAVSRALGDYQYKQVCNVIIVVSYYNNVFLIFVVCIIIIGSWTRPNRTISVSRA